MIMRGKQTVKTIKHNNVGVKWGWFLTLGIILLIFGFIACINLVLATVVSVLFIGTFMLFGGVVQIVHAFNVKKWSQFFLWLLAGLLYTLAGIICFLNPIFAASVLLLLLAFALIIAGIMRIIIGIQSRPVSGSGWIVVAGIITTLLGIMILIQWPFDSLWVLGLFLAIDLIFQGWGWIAFAFGLKNGLYTIK